MIAIRQQATTFSPDELRYHVLADPCDECEEQMDLDDIEDLCGNYDRGCTEATVVCSMCGEKHRRDIPRV